MRYHAQATIARQGKRRRVWLGRVELLAAAKTYTDHATVAIGQRVAGGLNRCLNRITPGNLRRQPDLHPVQFAGLLRAVTVAIEHLHPAGALADRLGWCEDALQVGCAVAGRLGRVIHNDLPEVICGPQRAGGQLPDFDEMAEVAELIQLGKPFDRVCRKGHAVAARDLRQSSCPDGALQMHMQLDLREGHASDYRGNLDAGLCLMDAIG